MIRHLGARGAARRGALGVALRQIMARPAPRPMAVATPGNKTRSGNAFPNPPHTYAAASRVQGVGMAGLLGTPAWCCTNCV